MIIESLFTTNFGTQLLIKAFLVLFLVFYFFFSILLIRQVQIMAGALRTGLNPVLKLISILNFAVSLIVLAVAVFS